MKKRRSNLIAVIIISTILLTTICAFAISEIVNNVPTDVPAEFVVKNNGALKKLEKSKKKGEAVQNQVEYYAYFVSVLQPSKEEKNYIDGLIEAGCDVEALVKIFDFWRYTVEDIGIIEKVYEYKPYDLSVSYWVDEAFIDLHKKGEAVTEYGNLSVEQVKAYIAEGIDSEEICAADKMSRKGIKSTETILSEKKTGNSWYDIADEIYGIEPSKNDAMEFSDIKDPNEIIESVKLAKRANRPVKDVLREVVNGESSAKKNYDFKTEKTNEAKVSLKKQKLWDESAKKEKKKAVFGEEDLF